MKSFKPIYSYKNKDYTLLKMRLFSSTQVLTLKVNSSSNKMRILLTNLHNPNHLSVKEMYILINDTKYPVSVNDKTRFKISPHSELYSDEISIDEKHFNEIKVVVRFGLFNKAYDASDFNNDLVAKSEHFKWNNKLNNLGIKSQVVNKPNLQIVVLVRQVEILSNIKTITFFGDSLTNHSHYTAPLSKELLDRNEDIYILNAGISGNHLLRDGKGIQKPFGVSGVKRIYDDVFKYNKPEVTVVALGINDLIHPGYSTPPTFLPTSDQMIEGYRKLLKVIRDNDSKAVINTITPFKDYNIAILKQAEEVRQEVNAWIRNQNEFDFVIDLDKIIRDKDDNSKLADEFVGDDFLHWDAQGGKIIAKQIDLDALIELAKSSQE